MAVEVEKDLLLLVDCRTALTEIEKWIREGSKVYMAMVKDADILRAVIERLRSRIEAGASTFLVKIKAHRGELLNEGADDESDRRAACSSCPLCAGACQEPLCPHVCLPCP